MRRVICRGFSIVSLLLVVVYLVGCGVPPFLYEEGDCNPMTKLPAEISSALFKSDLGHAHCKAWVNEDGKKFPAGCERVCMRARIVNDPKAGVFSVPHIVNTAGKLLALSPDTGKFEDPMVIRVPDGSGKYGPFIDPPWKTENRMYFMRNGSQKGEVGLQRHKDFCNEIEGYTYDCFGSQKCYFFIDFNFNSKDDDRYQPPGKFGTCSVRFPEVCDGKDNDGDGKADNGISCGCKEGETQKCTAIAAKGICQQGTQTCTSEGKWGECQPGQPNKEICDDQKDNDCDGEIDEDCGDCTPKETRSCQADNAQGVCRNGQQTCDNTKTWGTCVPSKPKKEECNGQDDDCDGKVDGNTRPCYRGPSGTEDKGLCKAGVQTCENGRWNLDCKNEVTPTKETCDTKDNDCDGQIDEDGVCGPCKPGDKRDCYSGASGTEKKLPCKKGQQTCGQDSKWGACEGEVTPQKELCDGIDNDCNGKVDDTFTKKGQSCTVGVGECQRSGTWVCKSDKTDLECSVKPGQSAQESCDGKDNNCDGQVDENLSRVCYSGPAGTNGKGVCKGGTQICVNGNWGTCSGQVTPKTESCNNQDDDCDGSIDESLTRACYTGASGTQGVGPCKGGTETCAVGKWGACVGEVTPVKEACDQVDNDCDGSIDEDGVCGSCTPNATQNCTATTAKGECRNGTQTCTAQRQWGPCQPAASQTETCNNKDDDCDGLVDENLTRKCYTGSASTKNVGVCTEGTQTCTNGAWPTACTGEVLPAAKETCGNSKDDDCDGTVDNGCTSGPWTASVTAALHLVGYVTKIPTIVVGGAFKGSMTLGTTTLTSTSSTEDCFVAQIDKNGSFQWSVAFKGSQSDQCRVQALHIDATGNVYATGYYNGSIAFGAFNLTGQGGPHDIFVVKVDKTGKVLWAASGGGGSSIDVPRAITADSSGNVYITGQYNGAVAFGTVTITGTGGSYDVLIAKLDSTGKWSWAVRAGAGGIDDGYGIAVSGSSLYVTGKYRGNGVFGSLSAISSGDDGFLLKLGISGSTPTWDALKSFGGSAQEEAGQAVTVDSAGNLIVSGYIGNGAKFDTTTLTASGSRDAFVAKFDSTLKVTWAKVGGSTGVDEALAVAVDGSGQPHICGKNAANASFGTQTVSAAGSFASRLTSLGVFNWASSFGAGICTGVGVDTNGGVVTIISPASGSGGSVRYIPKP